MKVKCSEIKIGERVRKDLGDIDSLADNIEELGLLQPIGVTSGNDLVFGERRLAACKSLNYEEIEVVVVDSDGLLECETAENVSRKNFVMSERVVIRKILKDKFTKEKAELRKKGIKIKKVAVSATFYHKAAKASGVSYDTAKKENFIIKYGDQNTIDKVDNDELSVSKAYDLIKEKKEKSKAVSENIVNKIDSLPVEESVKEPVDPPIELLQIDDSIYNIVLSDSYSSITLPTSLSDKIQHYSKTIETPPLTYIMNTFAQCFENYSVGA